MLSPLSLRSSSLLLLFLALGLCAEGTAHAQKTPGAKGPYALTHVRVIATPSDTIEGATLVVRDDSIAAVGPDVPVPDAAQVIDGTDLTAYPGLIDAGTHLGLEEVGDVEQTIDHDEVGDLTAHMDALTAVNPNSVHIPVNRVSGVTTVLTEPTEGLLPGTAALIRLHGYTPEQMHLGGVKVTKLDFPSTGRTNPSDARSPDEIEEEAENALQELNDLWDRAELYARIDSAVQEAPNTRRKPEFVPAMEGLLPVIRGEQPLLIAADAAPDIQSALDWAEERDITDQVILSGVTEGWRVADRIAEADVPVLVGSVLQTPTRDSDRYDKVYRNPGLLHEAGVQVALRTSQVENVRNLPFHAGFAANYGLGKTEALRAVTTTPARIFDVDDQVGSLEVGKQATLFVTDGDPFEPKTEVHHLFIDGYKLPLENRHTRLYDEFLHRNPGLVK